MWLLCADFVEEVARCGRRLLERDPVHEVERSPFESTLVGSAADFPFEPSISSTLPQPGTLVHWSMEQAAGLIRQTPRD